MAAVDARPSFSTTSAALNLRACTSDSAQHSESEPSSRTACDWRSTSAWRKNERTKGSAPVGQTTERVEPRARVGGLSEEQHRLPPALRCCLRLRLFAEREVAQCAAGAQQQLGLAPGERRCELEQQRHPAQKRHSRAVCLVMASVT
eukprot:scaffold54313_cov63-Phaeocystis_antarctica.AAC.3